MRDRSVVIPTMAVLRKKPRLMARRACAAERSASRKSWGGHGSEDAGGLLGQVRPPKRWVGVQDPRRIGPSRGSRSEFGWRKYGRFGALRRQAPGDFGAIYGFRL